MLMEFADESPFGIAEKTAFTPDWASSKLPSTAQTLTLRPACVTIWAFCTALTPSRG